MAFGVFTHRKIVRQVWWLIAAMGVIVPSTGYASPSFDCHKASAPIEILICANPDLAALDESVAAAFRAGLQASTGNAHTALLARQRSWLLQRESACRIPPKQAELHLEEWNTVMECVSRLYRDRIAELRPHAAAPDISTSSGGLVHPVCLPKLLWSIWNQEPPAQASFSLKGCNAENAGGLISIDRGVISEHTADQLGYYEYKPNAILPDGRQLFVVYDGGGSGKGSQVALISRTQESGETVVRGNTVMLGDDRCGGFISAATPDDAGVLIDLDVNPNAFLGFAGVKGGPVASVGYNDCIGTIRVRVPLNHLDDPRWVKAISGTVKSNTLDLRAADGNHCFDVAVSEIRGTLPKQFDRPAFEKLGKSYEACFAKTSKEKAQ